MKTRLNKLYAGNSMIWKTSDKITVIDFKMITFSSGKDYAIDIMKVKEIAKADILPTCLHFFFVLCVHIISRRHYSHY